jgi:hypothetical protein
MSTTYWTAFGIADKPRQGRSQIDRRRALIEVVSKIACSAVWTETPDFMIFDSRIAIDDITDRFKSAIDDEVDLFVLVCTHSKAGRIVGANPDKDIFKLMTSIESG